MFKEDGERVATLAGAKADADARDPSRRMAELNFILSLVNYEIAICIFFIRNLLSSYLIKYPRRGLTVCTGKQ
jgi:hypothetical protein